MIFWILLVTVVIIIILILIISRVTVQIGFHRSPDDQRVDYTIYLFNKVKIYKKKIVLREPNINTEEEYKKYILGKIEKGIDIIINFVDITATYNDLLKSISGKLQKGFKKGRFEIITKVGTGDAALTGLLCGLVWTILGNLRMQKDYQSVFQNVDFFVQPDFNKKIFAVDLECIFTIKSVYIIYVINSLKMLFGMEKERIKHSKIENFDDEKYLETG